MKKILIIIAVVILGYYALRAGTGFYIKSRIQTCVEGTSPQALEACTFLIDRLHSDPMVATFLASRGMLQDKSGKKAEALSDYKAMVELSDAGKSRLPADTLLLTYERLSSLGAELGELEISRTYTELAIANGSRSPQVYMTKGLIDAASKQFPEAIANLKRSEELGFLDLPEANVAQLLYTYGWAYLESGNYPLAFQYLYKAEPLMTDSKGRERINKKLGRACYLAKLYPEAKQRLQSVLDSGAQCPDCSDMLALIAQAEAAKPARGKRTKKTL